VYAAYCGALIGMVGLPIAVISTLVPSRSWRWGLAHHGARLLFRLSGTPLVVHGEENLPAAGGGVVVANHASVLDPFVLLAATARPSCFVAGEVFARRWFSGYILRRFGVEFVERADRAQAVTDAQRLITIARSGRILVFFPEGGLSRLRGLRPFHLGAFVSAAATGAPVIPVAIRGTRSVLGPGRRYVRHGAVTLTITEPLLPSGTGWRAAVELMRDARAVIGSECGEPDLA
jgi:1-acyl-sn-glycerol-3-phosphate acyltransferase